MRWCGMHGLFSVMFPNYFLHDEQLSELRKPLLPEQDSAVQLTTLPVRTLPDDELLVKVYIGLILSLHKVLSNTKIKGGIKEIYSKPFHNKVMNELKQPQYTPLQVKLLTAITRSGRKDEKAILHAVYELAQVIKAKEETLKEEYRGQYLGDHTTLIRFIKRDMAVLADIVDDASLESTQAPSC